MAARHPLVDWEIPGLQDKATGTQSLASDEIIANQNRTPAGKLENGVLTVHLEIVSGTWHAEAGDGPPLYVQAFVEAAQPASIPGPLLRMPVGTTVKVTIDNKLKNLRPCLN